MESYLEGNLIPCSLLFCGLRTRKLPKICGQRLHMAECTQCGNEARWWVCMSGKHKQIWSCWMYFKAVYNQWFRVHFSTFLLHSTPSFILFHSILNCPTPGICSGGKEWQDCGTACPPTCYNYNSTFSCIPLCVSSCFCPQGTVDHNGECVNPSQCPGKLSNISTLQVCYWNNY